MFLMLLSKIFHSVIGEVRYPLTAAESAFNTKIFLCDLKDEYIYIYNREG